MHAVVNPTGKHRPKRRRHGEGSRPFRVKDTRRRKPWRCDVRMGRDPITGKLRTRSFWGTSAEEAAAERDAFLRRLEAAGSVEGADRTVKAALTEWLAGRKGEVDSSTFRRYAAAIDQHLVPSLGDLLAVEVTAEHVRAARGGWRNQKTDAPLSASSSNLVLGILRSALGRDAPTVKRRKRQGPPAARYLDEAQARKLLASLEGDPLELIVKVALAVGPRRGEVLGIRWPDLDLEAGTWTLDQQVRYISPEARKEGDGPYALVPPKVDEARGRTIALPAFVVDALTEYEPVWKARKRRAPVWVKPGDLVFCDDHGQALPPGSVSRRFRDKAEAALGFPMRLHDTRHSAATLMLAMGVPERVVQEILGHASGATTRGYMHVVKRLGTDAAERMDRAIGGVR